MSQATWEWTAIALFKHIHRALALTHDDRKGLEQLWGLIRKLVKSQSTDEGITGNLATKLDQNLESCDI